MKPFATFDSEQLRKVSKNINGTPRTILEYIWSVRNEANNLPAYSVSDKMDSTTIQNTELTHPLLKLADNVEILSYKESKKFPDIFKQERWLKTFVEARKKVDIFKQIKDIDIIAYVDRIPPSQIKDEKEWIHFCFDTCPNTSIINNSTTSFHHYKNYFPPYVSLLGHMKQSDIFQLLKYHIGFLQTSGYSLEQGSWFYALLVMVDNTTLNGVNCDTLRLLVKCLDYFYRNFDKKINNDTDVILDSIFLIITIVKKFFGQHDL